MESANTAPRTGPFDVPDTFVAGLALALGLNAAQFGLLYLAPVMNMFAPLFGFTQFLYTGPLVAEFILNGKKKAATGVTVGSVLCLAITLVRLMSAPWNEEYYFGE